MKVEESLALAATPQAIWPWVSEPARLSQWIDDVERFELRPPGALAAGSILVAHPPRGAPIEARVESVVPARELVLRASGLPNDITAVLTFQIAEQAGGSVLTARAEAKLTGFMVFGEKLLASKARKKVESWTANLRALVEGR